MLTRRHFLYGAAGVAALALMGGTAYATGHSKSDSSLATLRVPEDAVFSSNDLEKIEDPAEAMTVTASAELPYGTLVWCSDDAVAACLLPTETANPLAQVGLFYPESGEVVTVVENAVGQDEGFQIYDVRANSAGVIWTEADILDGIWRVYGAALSGETLGEPQLLDEGDADWEMPSLAVASSYGFWQRLPQLTGNARIENSLLKRARFGTAEAEVVYESQGRMACPPTSCGDTIVATPRARTSGTYYQLTRIDGATGQVTDACVLPSSMRPLECGWGKTGFNFAFDGIYNYGEGIKNLGTYMPLEMPDTGLAQTGAAESPDGLDDASVSEGSAFVPLEQTIASTEAYGDVPWFHYARNPLFAPAWCGNWVLMRGQSNVAAIDLESKRYAALPLESGSSNGEFLASTNMGSRAITYSDIDYTPLDGEQRKCCLVRVWEAV